MVFVDVVYSVNSAMGIQLVTRDTKRVSKMQGRNADQTRPLGMPCAGRVYIYSVPVTLKNYVDHMTME